MNYRTIFGELIILLQTTQLVMNIRIRLALKQSIAIIISIICLTTAVIFMNIAAYFAFLETFGPIGTPLSLAIINFILVLISLGAFLQFGSSTQLGEAQKLREYALYQLRKELQPASLFYALLSPEILVQVLPILMKFLKNLKGKKKDV